jgi:hypothetical protein
VGEIERKGKRGKEREGERDRDRESRRKVDIGRER